jgi:hypothetical protein
MLLYLSLADNGMDNYQLIKEISIIENLEGLTSLKTLLIGNNKIRNIGHSLNSNHQLKVF